MRNQLKHNEHLRVSASTIRSIETAIEEQFFHRASDLLKDPIWASYRTEIHGPHGPALSIREFTARYTDLLGWAFTEYLQLLQKFLITSKRKIAWQEAEESAFHFAEPFVRGGYYHPWTGDFLCSQQWVNPQSAMQEYRRLHESAPWFSDRLFATWERIFPKEVRSGDWRERAVKSAKRGIHLVVGTATPIREVADKMQRIEPANLPTLHEFCYQYQTLTHKCAAQFLGCDPRTIRNYLRKGQLSKANGGKVRCDDKWSRKVLAKYPAARVK